MRIHWFHVNGRHFRLKMRFQKYPDCCGRGLVQERLKLTKGNFNNTRIKEHAWDFECDNLTLPQDFHGVVKCGLTRANLFIGIFPSFLLATAAFSQNIERGFDKLTDIKGKENTCQLLDAWLPVFETLICNSKKRWLLSDHSRCTFVAILLLRFCPVDNEWWWK